MTSYDLEDDFGRHTRFEGEILVQDTTDTEDGQKPQWSDITIYRTAGGRYVVETNTAYRVRHLSDRCRKALGYELRPALHHDTRECPVCNPAGIRSSGGYGQAGRTKVEVCDTPADLISSLSSINQNNGRPHHSTFSQALLAQASEVDPAIDEAWMIQVVK